MANQNIAIIGTYLGSYILAVVGIHFIVKGILKRYPLPEPTSKCGLKGAGAMIGFLERIFVLTLVLTGQYASIALIFTGKSIARFEELKKREFAEYYLIGTFSSILFSMLVGILTKRLLYVIDC